MFELPGHLAVKLITAFLGLNVSQRKIRNYICMCLCNFKTQYYPLSIACCDLLAGIFVISKILRRLFATSIELVNNRHLAPVKTQTTTEMH